MAVFAYSAPFDPASLDLHGTFGFGHQAVQIGAQDINIPGLTIPLPTGDLIIPPGQISVDQSELVVTLSGDKLLLGGTGLGLNHSGLPSGGTISELGLWNGSTPALVAYGPALDGRNFAAAVATAATTDDRLMYQSLFSGNDLILGSSAADVVLAGAGRDFVSDTGGSNSVVAGTGDDFVFTGAGDDSVRGGGGKDVLLDIGGANHLRGGAGADLIGAMNGDGVLSGNQGADLFLFKAGSPAQSYRITDFVAGQDRIALLSSAMALDDLTITQRHGGTLITVDDITLHLSHVTASSLQASDFAFNDTSGLTEAVGAFFDGWAFLA